VKASVRRRRVRAVGRTVRKTTAVLLPFLAALAATSARAADTRAPAAATPGVVWLELHAAPEEATTLRATLAELCARLELVLRDGPGSGEAVAKLSIDLSRAAPGGVVVRSGNDGRLILRRSLPVDSSRPVVLESAATIAYTALETLVQESQQGPQRRPDERAATAATSGPAREPTITQVGPAAPRPAHFGLEVAPLFQVRTGEVQRATAWGGGLRAGGGWRSVPLEPAFALTGTLRQATAAVRTYSLRLSATATLLSLRGVAFQTGPSFARESTTWSAPNPGMYGMGPPPPAHTSALRPGWEARLLLGPVAGVQAFLGVNGDCALAPVTPPALFPPMGMPSSSPQGARCGLAAELGVAVTLFGAPAVHAR
jgi:hypothetical protein